MDVQVDQIDIRQVQLPAHVKVVNVLLSCALVAYIVGTILSLRQQSRHELTMRTPLLNDETEL